MLCGMRGDGDGIREFYAARLDDDERFMRVLMAAGARRAGVMTGKDMADALGLLMTALSDPEAHAELERWPDGGVMPPSACERILADIAMKRALLRAHSLQPLVTEADLDSPLEPDGPWRRCAAHDWVTWPCGTVRIIVATWSAHPGYRREWSP
jgi:hypothetical protein